MARLEHRLRTQEIEITSKNDEITRIKAHFEQTLKEQATQHKTLMDKAVAEVYRHERSKLQAISASTKQEIERSFEYVAGKMRDLESKIRLVVDSHEGEAKNSRIQNEQIHAMAAKLKEIRA